MPEINGLDLLKEIKKKRSIDIPFIIFTGKGREEVAMEALNNGADRYIKKGGDPTSQFRILKDAIKQETRLYKINKELETQRIYFEELFEGSPEAIVLTDKEGNVINVNKSFEELFEYKLKEIKNKNIDDIVTSEEHIEEARKIARQTLDGKTIEIESQRKKKSGKKFPALIISYPIKISQEIIGAYGIYRDKTRDFEKSKEIEMRTRELENIIGGMNDAVFIHNLDGNFLRVNQETVDRLGYSREKLLEMTPTDIDSSKFKEKVDDRIENLRKGKNSYLRNCSFNQRRKNNSS